MSKANPNAITPTNRRRFLRLAAGTAAATALLSAPALAKGRDDTRLFAMIARVRPLLSAHAAAEERSHAAYALVEADPDRIDTPVGWVDEQLANGSPLSRRALCRLCDARTAAVYRRHGYDTASDEWNRLGHELRSVHLPRLLSMRPRTTEGARDKWRLVFEAFRETEQWDPEDFDEFMVPALLADLKRLAGKAVQS
jgi:hypothetical protein